MHIYLGILALGLEVILNSRLDRPVESSWLWEDGQFVGNQLADIELPIARWVLFLLQSDFHASIARLHCVQNDIAVMRSYFMIASTAPNSWYISKTYVNKGDTYVDVQSGEWCDFRSRRTMVHSFLSPVDWRVSVCHEEGAGREHEKIQNTIVRYPSGCGNVTGVTSRPAPSRSVSTPPGCLFKNLVTS